MNKTLFFAKLDYLTIRPYLTLKNMLIFLMVFVIVGYGMGDNPSALIGMIMMYGTIYATNPFAVGDKNGIDTLYATLPITKKNVVIGRYVFALSLNIFIAVIAFVLSLIFMMLPGKEFNLTKTLLTLVVCFSVFTILLAIQLPIYFKHGYAKAKFLAYLPLAAFPAVVILASTLINNDSLSPFIENMSLWVKNNTSLVVMLAIIIWGLIMLFSILLSYRFYRKREI